MAPRLKPFAGPVWVQGQTGLSSGAIRIVSRTMTISLDIREYSAVFRYPQEYDDCVERFDQVLEEWDAGRLNAKVYLDRLRDLLAQHPWFIDVHAHIGSALMWQGKTGLALAAYQKGIALGTAAIPQGYSGMIEWDNLENRPFLRAVHGATICHLRRRHWRKAIPLLENLLAWNPKDNQGIRYLIGSVYLRAGKLDEASTALDLRGDLDPGSLYDLGLLLFVRRQYMAAATALRNGSSRTATLPKSSAECQGLFPLRSGMAQTLLSRNMPKTMSRCSGSCGTGHTGPWHS